MVAIRHWISTEADETFVRSSGPGGQNVNKVSSAAVCHIAIDRLAGVSESERVRLMEKLKNRINSEGYLVIKAQDSRSQLDNRELVVERAMTLIIQALHRDKPRRATKPSKASKERRVATKKLIAKHKKNRSRPGED